MTDGLDDLATLLLQEPWLNAYVEGDDDDVATVRRRFTDAQRSFTQTRSVPLRARRGSVRTTALRT